MVIVQTSAVPAVSQKPRYSLEEEKRVDKLTTERTVRVTL